MESIGAPNESIVLLNRVRLYKKMDMYQRQILVNQARNGQERTMLARLFTTPGEL